jgi:4'-phosphopantetheinyl transferase
VWSVRTAAPTSVIGHFEQVLSPDERDRAARFRFPHLRDSFILARGCLRLLLGRYLNVSPAGIQFRYGAKGKPSIDGVDFNMSHSGGLAVFAFTRGCELGVDVEKMRPLDDMQNIANRFFCREEAMELMSLPPEQREHAFFLCWTRKEAYIKAVGDGLSVPLDSFRVTLKPLESAQFLHIAQDPQVAKGWTLHNFQLNSGYAAALAYYGTERPITQLPVINPAQLLSIP